MSFLRLKQLILFALAAFLEKGQEDAIGKITVRLAIQDVLANIGIVLVAHIVPLVAQGLLAAEQLEGWI